MGYGNIIAKRKILNVMAMRCLRSVYQVKNKYDSGTSREEKRMTRRIRRRVIYKTHNQIKREREKQVFCRYIHRLTHYAY